MKSTTNTLYQGMSGRLGDLVVSQQGGQTVIRQRPYPRTRFTDDQQQVRLAFQQASGRWKTLSAVQMQSWRAIAPKIPRWDAAPNAVPLTGQQAFVGMAMNRYVLGLEPLLLAPFVPTVPPFLCEWQARQVGTGADFSLFLDSAGYDGWVQILATPPLSRGRDVVGLNRYAQICVVPALPGGAGILTEWFTRKYRAPFAFEHIGVRLVPLSTEGFRGASVTQASVLPEDGVLPVAVLPEDGAGFLLELG